MSKKAFYLLLAASLLSFGGVLAIYRYLPGQIPLQYNWQGEVASLGHKSAAFLFAALPLALLVTLYLFPTARAKKNGNQAQTKAFTIVAIVTTLFLISQLWLLLLSVLFPGIALLRWMLCLLGIALVLIGNYLPQIRANYFVGVRLPWLFGDERVWQKTNRLGGWALVLWGILLLLSGLSGLAMLRLLSLVVMVASLAGLVIYSYWLYRHYYFSRKS